MESISRELGAAPAEDRRGAVSGADRGGAGCLRKGLGELARVSWGGCAVVTAFLALTLASTSAARAETTVFVVRHAEKVDSSVDAELDGAGRERSRLLRDMLRSLPVDAVYASKYQRTQQTVAPTAEALDVPISIHETADIDPIGAALRTAARDSVDRYVLVSGHSNTIIQWLRALGITSVTEIMDHEHDNLFVVTLGDANRSRLLRLRYGY